MRHLAVQPPTPTGKGPGSFWPPASCPREQDACWMAATRRARGRPREGVLCETGGPVGALAVPRVVPSCVSITEEGRRTGE